MASIHISPPVMYMAGIIWPPVCTAIVGLRFATRKNQRLKFGVDDWLVLSALVFLYVMCVAVIAGTALGAVAHKTPQFAPNEALTETSEKQKVTKIVYWISVWSSILAVGSVKLSAIFFYRRIFASTRRGVFNFLSWVAVGVLSLWTVSFFLSFLFLCGTKYVNWWTSVENQAKCGNIVVATKALAITDVITDGLILIFPMPSVWRLQMRIGQKLAIMGIFIIGSLALAASFTRLVIFIQALSAEYMVNTDEDLLSTAGIYFVILESGFGLTAVCLPSLSGAVRRKSIERAVNGFVSVFSSNNSKGSGLNETNSDHKFRRFGSSIGSDHSQSSPRNIENSIQKLDDYPLKNLQEDGIHVVQDFDTRSMDA